MHSGSMGVHYQPHGQLRHRHTNINCTKSWGTGAQNLHHYQLHISATHRRLDIWHKFEFNSNPNGASLRIESVPRSHAPLASGLEGEVGAHSVGSVAHHDSQLVGGEALRSVCNDGCLCAKPCADEVVVDCSDCQQAGNGWAVH